MISTRKKRPENKTVWPLADFDQVVTIRNITCNDRQDFQINVGQVVSEHTADKINGTESTNDSIFMFQTLRRSTFDGFAREMSDVLNTSEHRIQIFILAARYYPVRTFHCIPLVSIGSPGHSHRWIFGGQPVVHWFSAPILDMAVDGQLVASIGILVAIDGNETLKDDLCSRKHFFLSPTEHIW